MPLVQSFVQHVLRQKPIVVGNCDEMIARGLGLVCAVKELQEEIKDYILTDICPFTLGTDIFNEADPQHSYMSPIVPRNSVLPCSKVKRFYTIKDDQQKIDLNILQGEQVYAEDNLSLDKLTIPIPKAKKGEESVDVRFTYDINGILLVDVTVVSTGKTVSKVVSQNVSEEDLYKKIQELEKLKVHPKNVSENQLLLERLRALYEEAPTYLRENILEFIREFEKILEGQDTRRIKKYRKFLEKVIKQYSFVDPFAGEFKFEEFEEDEEQGEEEEFDFYSALDGGSEWTS